jgi:predicted nucleic acid-binding Zn ribbon protein
MKALKAQAPYSKVVFNSCVVCSKAWAAKRAKSICSPGCGNEKAMQTYRAWYEKEVESRPLKKCKQCDTFQNYPLSVFCSIECNGKLISLALD